MDWNDKSAKLVKCRCLSSVVDNCVFIVEGNCCFSDESLIESSSSSGSNFYGSSWCVL